MACSQPLCREKAKETGVPPGITGRAVRSRYGQRECTECVPNRDDIIKWLTDLARKSLPPRTDEHSVYTGLSVYT